MCKISPSPWSPRSSFDVHVGHFMSSLCACLLSATHGVRAFVSVGIAHEKVPLHILVMTRWLMRWACRSWTSNQVPLHLSLASIVKYVVAPRSLGRGICTVWNSLGESWENPLVHLKLLNNSPLALTNVILVRIWWCDSRSRWTESSWKFWIKPSHPAPEIVVM